MQMDKDVKRWEHYIVTFISGIIICACTYLMTRKGMAIDKNDEYIKSLAKTVYVDQQNKGLQEQIDKKLDAQVFYTYLKGQETFQNIVITDMSDIKKLLMNTKK